MANPPALAFANGDEGRRPVDVRLPSALIAEVVALNVNAVWTRHRFALPPKPDTGKEISKVAALNKVPNDLLILVCDARKALLMTNAGSPARPQLHIEEHIEAPEGAERVAGNDRRGKRYDGGGTGGSFRARSSMETSDTDHERAAEFASEIVEKVTAFRREKPIGQILLVAPPAFLGVLRAKVTDEIESLIVSEIPKHFTDLPVAEIQKSLVETW